MSFWKLYKLMNIGLIAMKYDITLNFYMFLFHCELRKEKQWTGKLFHKCLKSCLQFNPDPFGCIYI